MVQGMDGKVAVPIGELESKIILRCIYNKKLNNLENYQRINLVYSLMRYASHNSLNVSGQN
jgi:hypothetical protein